MTTDRLAPRTPVLGLSLAVALLAAGAIAPARALAAEHAKVQLDVTTPGDRQTAFVDQTPPDSGKNPRPVVKARAGEAIKIQYMFTNVYPNKTIKDVVLHFYVARIDAVGQKDLPTLDGGPGVVLETAFDMDFRPGGKGGGRTTLRIDTPGVYLIRVESRETQSDHEHFAAIDLVVEPATP